MTKETKKIRHGLYEYIESQFGKLTPEQRGVISSAVQEHADNKIANLKSIARQHDFANNKISQYLKKARLNYKQFQKEIQTLEVVSNWLNSDAE